MSELRPKIGISACLLGEAVRYNGAHKRLDWIVDTLGTSVDFVSLCPEKAMGLGVPRPAMRLRTDGRTVRLETINDRLDLSELARATAARLVDDLPADLDAYVLMQKSPSCGLEKVKIYDKNEIPSRHGPGFFAGRLAEKRPDLLLIESGRLSDPEQRDAFVTRLWAHFRFKHLGSGVAALQTFHRNYKFLLLAFAGQGGLKRLGRFAADGQAESYRTELRVALAGVPRRGTVTDALIHMYGYLKEALTPGEKQTLLRSIEDFRLEKVPVAVPLALLDYANARVGNAYLGSQVLLKDPQ